MRRWWWLTAALALGCGKGKDGGEPVDPSPDGACEAYEYNGATYDCTVMDPCEPDGNAFRSACCACDPTLCDLGPDCDPGDDDDDDTVPDDTGTGPGPTPTVTDTGRPPLVDTSTWTGGVPTTTPTYTGTVPPPPGESCMVCHNGSAYDDYAGQLLTNPHPFAPQDQIKCTTCHGGNGAGVGKDGSHVPPPPQIGDDLNQFNNPESWFNRLTLVGLDKYPDYTANGTTWESLDYLQFVNPGDLRVVSQGRSCGRGGCHGGEHADWVNRYPIATEVGFYSGTMFTNGLETPILAQQGIYNNTAGGYGFRYVEDPTWVYDRDETGRVGELWEFPEKAVYGDPTGIYNNPLYDSNNLALYVYDPNVDPQKSNRIKAGFPMEHLLQETVAFFCGDCHLGSAGANNRYGDFRSSGCTSCHMEYSFDGKSRSTDPNVNKLEPANPDAIAAPERPHIMDHRIRNVYKTLPNGQVLSGIRDKACIGCHQGSNRTVLQYWGVRLDQNQDLHNGFQYPANPVTFVDATGDTRLFDPGVGNATFNGRVPEQLIVFEDYDGDGRDDTPPDVHYEAGMGCIDCHGSRDVHGGTDGDPTSGWINSRESQTVGIQCVSCHGGISSYATYEPCTDYNGNAASCATDRLGNSLRNVTRDVNGDFWLKSRLDGQLHFVPQTKDVVVRSAKAHPLTGQTLYSPLGSYAMGRADGSNLTGTGPIQTDPTLYTSGFSHTDEVECVACHASWTNSCVGCHLELTYDANPANYTFSNTTGERITVKGTRADFVYQTPILMNLGVSVRDEITAWQPGMKMFFRYVDYNGTLSNVFAFTDVNGNGNNPNTGGRGEFGALAHNKIMPHSVRGKVTANMEGPRYCVACHLTVDAIDNFGAEYDTFRAALDNRDYDQLDFNLLQQHIGLNTGNQLNSPFFVHQAAGLGSGLFLFDQFGCPVNPLDNNANRQYCVNGAPANNFDLNNVAYDLDKIVEFDGTANSSSGHPLLDNNYSQHRAGALDPGMAGPFGATLLERMTDPNIGIVLDSWIDANGALQGDAALYAN